MKQKAYKAALREGAPQEEVDRLYDEWQESQREDTEDDSSSPMAFLNGYDFPKLFTLVHTDNWHATRFNWGLIPAWTKDLKSAEEIRAKTLNARGETMFEKSAFKDAALNKRCLIMVDGFFEYHHKNKKTYPYFIRHREADKPLVFGGLWDEWIDPISGVKRRTASIVTSQANKLMTRIHNNPVNSDARMPLILDSQDYEAWLSSKNKTTIQNLIKPFSNDYLESYTVKRLIGKNGVGDSPDAIKEHYYPDLAEQGTLF